jgi:capsular polysaccharide transport system ATP-binding protein
MLKSLRPSNDLRAGVTFLNVAKLASEVDSEGIIFHSLSTTLPTNRSVAILGRQESGRTTLLHLLAQQIMPDAGVVRVDAKFSMILNSKSYLDSKLTGIENIESLARMFSLNPNRMIRIIMTLSGVQPRSWHVMVGSLESRIRKSMEMLVAAILPFDCYLIDDIEKVDQSVAGTLIRLVRTRGAGIIFTTFRPRTARQFADCACVIHNKKLYFFETLAAAEAFYG